MIKKLLSLLLGFCTVFSLYAGGNTDTIAKIEPQTKNGKAYAIDIPDGAELGDFFSVKFTAQKSIERAWITIFNAEKKNVQTVKAFPINTEKTEWAAVAAAAVWWKPGQWEIKAEAVINNALLEEIKKIRIIKKEFKEIVMNLNAKNTAIIYKKSPEKDEQRNRLNTVLKTQDQQARLFNGPFVLPFQITRISSDFAEKRISKFSNGKTSESRHWGIDYPAPTGTAVKAPGNGKVVLAEKRIVTGWTLVLEHLPGVYTLYYHLNKIHVMQGSFVTQGALIAEVGTTGFSTGPHLHWELRINEIPANPALLLKKTFF